MPASAAWNAASRLTAAFARLDSPWTELSSASESTPSSATTSTISTIVTPSSRRSAASRRRLIGPTRIATLVA